MTIVRFYPMKARPREEQALLDALVDPAREIRPLDGCLGFEILRDVDNAANIQLIERWTSAQAHQSTSGQLTKNVLTPVMATLVEPTNGFISIRFSRIEQPLAADDPRT